MITIRTRLTLVVVFATVAGAVVGWLLRGSTRIFVGRVRRRRRRWPRSRRSLLSRMLVTDPATSILQAVSDGLLSFSEREYGMRLAVPSTDEPLGDLVRRFNKLGEVLRTEHSDRYQREILLETVLETTAMAVVLCNEALRIVYANGAARDLFGGGRKLDGEDFRAILARAPAAFREAIERETDTIFSVETAARRTAATGGADGGIASAPETYHLARRYFQLSMQPHILFILKPLTRAILRKEADTWKRTIRVISHEINNSLAPISSLIHSGRLMLQKPEMVPRLAEALDTIEERSTHLRGFIEGYAKFARLPLPAKQENRWDPLIDGLRPLYSFQVEGKLPDAAGHVRRRPDAAGPDQPAQERGRGGRPGRGHHAVRHRGPGRRVRGPRRGPRQGDARRRHEERAAPVLLDQAVGQRPGPAALPRDRRGPRRDAVDPPARRRRHQRRLPDSLMISVIRLEGEWLTSNHSRSVLS